MVSTAGGGGAAGARVGGEVVAVPSTGAAGVSEGAAGIGALLDAG